MKNSLKSLAIATGVTLSFGIQAAYLDFDYEGTDLVPPANDYAQTGGSLYNVGDTVYTGATIKADGAQTGPFQLTFTYLFKEAAYDNQFFYGGDMLFSTNSNSYGDSVSKIYNGGAGNALEFLFRTVKTDGSVVQIANADNTDLGVPNFHTYWMDTNTFIVSLDDSGAGPDDNHDDMVIKITASAVPEPGTLALLGLGLAGMGMGMRRRSKA